MSDALTDAIAIVGISCRVPGAPSVDALWQNVRRGVESIARYSDAALYGMWGHLDDAVKEGSHRWTQSFGLEGPIFSAFFRTPIVSL